MSTQTTNYKLVKPEPQDFIDISTLNGNMDIVDAQLKKLNDEKLSTTGGTIKGDLIVESMISSNNTASGRNARIIAHNNAAKAVDFQNYVNDNNYQGVRIGMESGDLSAALTFIRMAAGNYLSYPIYHGGNKPTPADIGAVPIIHARTDSYDMDAILKSGEHLAFYSTVSATRGTPYKYGKTTASSASIMSYAINATNGTQVAFTAGGDVFYRSLINGTMSAWLKMYHEGNASAIVATASLEE